MKQVVGVRLRRRCEAIGRKAYMVCYANGTRLRHGIIECWFTRHDADRVDVRAGTTTPYVREGRFA